MKETKEKRKLFIISPKHFLIKIVLCFFKYKLKIYGSWIVYVMLCIKHWMNYCFFSILTLFKFNIIKFAPCYTNIYNRVLEQKTFIKSDIIRKITIIFYGPCNEILEQDFCCILIINVSLSHWFILTITKKIKPGGRSIIL